ncbi:MAG: ATP synthase F0 subunit B [bacterium]|nr:ATP synthase F0 subunit B [bacterium]MDT8367268.1 ATP synthase F0 subunit B [bacterium]
MRSVIGTLTGNLIRIIPLLILPAIALASGSEGGEAGSGRALWDLALRIINFAVLVGVLFYFARKPIVSAIRNSIESVRTLLKEAEESRKASEARMKEADDKLAGVDKEISDLLSAARREGEVERERILSEASNALDKLKGEAVIAIEQELKKAQDVLRREAADAAVALAREMISRNITPEDQARFVTEYLEKLEANQ